MVNGISDNTTLLTGKALSFEGVGANPMPKSSRVLFADTFDDGLYHGWRHTHFGGDVPFNPVSVERDYPIAGLHLATSSTPYRSGAVGGNVSSWKGLSGRFPTTGLISFAGLFAMQSGGPTGYAWSSWALEMDIQNWTDTKRSNPRFQCSNPGDGSAPRWQIRNDSSTLVSIGAATSMPNPVNSALSGVSATKSLTGGENENKWDINYVRVTFDLGNLMSITSGTQTSQYYELNINGYRFDLRSQLGGAANRSTQGGSAISTFKGGLNFGIDLNRDTTVGGKAYPARLVAGELTATYHETGWL